MLDRVALGHTGSLGAITTTEGTRRRLKRKFPGVFRWVIALGSGVDYILGRVGSRTPLTG